MKFSNSIINMLKQTPKKIERLGRVSSSIVLQEDTPLVKLSKLNGTDKWSHHSYIPIYEYLFEDIRFNKLNILEIGIFKGDSLRTWESYFPNSKIEGIDIDKKCTLLSFERAKVTICDQIDYKFLFNYYPDNYFDIVIEDGYHNFKHQILSACILYNKMKEDSVYIIEDIKGSMKNFNALRGISFDLTFLKSRKDDKMLLIPKGDYFSKKTFNLKSEFDNLVKNKKEITDLNYL